MLHLCNSSWSRWMGAKWGHPYWMVGWIQNWLECFFNDNESMTGFCVQYVNHTPCIARKFTSGGIICELSYQFADCLCNVWRWCMLSSLLDFQQELECMCLFVVLSMYCTIELFCAECIVWAFWYLQLQGLLHCYSVVHLMLLFVLQRNLFLQSKHIKSSEFLSCVLRLMAFYFWEFEWW